MTSSDSEAQEPPHDILAAEEFVVPAPDPRLRSEPPHDILAAEEFALPAPDVHRVSLVLPTDPDDPGGVEPPRDVLAAEEFAVPGTVGQSPPPGYQPVGGGPGPRAYLAVAGRLAAGALALALLVRVFGARRRR